MQFNLLPLMLIIIGLSSAQYDLCSTLGIINQKTCMNACSTSGWTWKRDNHRVECECYGAGGTTCPDAGVCCQSGAMSGFSKVGGLLSMAVFGFAMWF